MDFKELLEKAIISQRRRVRRAFLRIKHGFFTLELYEVELQGFPLSFQNILWIRLIQSK